MNEFVDALRDDPVVAATVLLAVVTTVLAIATFWLGWTTRSVSRATQQMADATKELLRIESDRRSEEGRAELIVEQAQSRVLGKVPISPTATVWVFTIRNTLPGEATDICVTFREGARSGAFRRDRLAGLNVLVFEEGDLTDDEVALRPDGNRYMQIAWTDARGRRVLSCLHVARRPKRIPRRGDSGRLTLKESGRESTPRPQRGCA